MTRGSVLLNYIPGIFFAQNTVNVSSYVTAAVLDFRPMIRVCSAYITFSFLLALQPIVGLYFAAF